MAIGWKRAVLLALFRTAWWPSAGKELSSWLSVCVVLYLMPSLTFVFVFCLLFRAEGEFRLYRFQVIALCLLRKRSTLRISYIPWSMLLNLLVFNCHWLPISLYHRRVVANTEKNIYIYFRVSYATENTCRSICVSSLFRLYFSIFFHTIWSQPKYFFYLNDMWDNSLRFGYKIQFSTPFITDVIINEWSCETRIMFLILL